MYMKKFEFTGETKILFNGTILHRIKALVEIKLGYFIVKAGDLGGWIEKEENLSHVDNAWVYGDAMVYGDAWVYGDAMVWGNARVYGDAMVCGDARVYGDSYVRKSEHCFVIGPIGSRNDYTTFTRNKDGEIKVKCGCFFGNIQKFLDKVEKTHGDSKYGNVYRLAVQVALEQIDTEPIEECVAYI